MLRCVLSAIAILFTFKAGADPDALAKLVEIRRDAYGVPHIFAQTEEAAAFGYGYAAAEDRCEGIARLYLKAKSREARYFGEEFEEADFRNRLFRVYEVAETGYAASPEWMRDILDGYAAGFNRYVEQHRTRLPEWIEPVTGIDVLAHARRVVNIEFSLDVSQIGDARAAANQTGSNMFAIGKSRSASGKAILVGNPHLAWTGSQTWHESHVTVPGQMNVHGATLVGFPLIAIGFNERLGWSHTVNPHDSTDLYELTLAPTDADTYMFDGKPRKLTKREVSIDVLVEGKVVTRRRTLYYAHQGPIVATNGETAYALASANYDEYRLLEQWRQMGRAKNLDEFRATLDIQGIPMFNIAYADADGNCFYICNGRFPQRPAGQDWTGVIRGDTSANDWLGLYPPAKLPQQLNPRSGYVHNANNAPWYTNLGEPIDKSTLPSDLLPDDNALRPQVGLAQLEADKSITFDEALVYKLNPKLLSADRLKADLVRLARGKTVDGASLDAAAKLLDAWDGAAVPESRGSVLFVEFVRAYAGKATQPYATAWDPAQPMTTPSGIGEPETALAMLAQSIGRVTSTYGAIDVPWKDVYRVRIGDVDVPVSGHESRYGSYRVIEYSRQPDNKWIADGGDSYVFAVEFSQPLRSVSVLPYGQSADPASPHYDDQAAMFAAGEFKSISLDEKDLAPSIKRSYRP